MTSRSIWKRLPLIFALALMLLAAADPFDEPVILGEGSHRYAWIEDWGVLPEGEHLGNTHGCVLVDARARVYANTDTENAVVVYGPDGARVASWGKELAGGLHGMALVEEDGTEFLYMTHLGRHAALKATLEGEVLWSVGWPEASGKYENEGQYNPTSIAVRPDGGFYVADGYGKSWIHQYDAERNWVRCFGGPGSEPGQLKTPHGIWLDTRGDEPVLLVADRENNRLQTFDLDGGFLAVVAEDLRRPCHVHQLGDELVVPELAGGVVLLDGENRFITRLGENTDPKKRANNGVAAADWTVGEFTAPHCATFDTQGNVYVLDWNFLGRVTKLERQK